MYRVIWKISKVTLLFIGCILLFYFSSRMFHEEYEKYRQNELQENLQIKVEIKNMTELL